MRVWAEVDLDKLNNNIKLIREISFGKKILGIIKANAYGHGAVEVARELSFNGIDFFGVACIDEAEEIIKNNIQGDILILGCTPIEEWERVIELNLKMTIASFEEVKEIEKRKIYPKVHIKIDTGMGRIGFTYEEALKAIEYIVKNNIAEVEGIFTHFAVADENIEYTKMQSEKFKKIVEKFDYIKYKHISNSAGIINYNDEYNMIRPGIIMYGVVPFKHKIEEKFLPILTLKSKIVFMKKTEEDTYISYGSSYMAKKGEIIATVSAGYADGVNRKLSNKGEVIVKGIRCKIVGRVCMDQFMIKIPENLKDVKIGEEVTIIGSGISVNDIAEKSDTIPYEILTSINVRVPRLYIKGGKIIQEKSLLGRKYKVNVQIF